MSAILQSVLDDLHATVANDAYLLYEALATLADGRLDNNAASIKQCIEYIERIEQVATQAHLAGLQHICELTCLQLQELQSDVSHQQQLCEVIERWPRLVSNYLYAPTNETTRQKLITLLQDQVWAIPLAEEQISRLNTLLAQDFNADEEASNQAVLTDDLSTIATIVSTVSSNDILSTAEPNETDDSALTVEETSQTVTNHDLSPEIIDEFDESALLADELPETVTEEVATPEIIDEFDESALLADELPETVTEEVATPEIIDEFDEFALLADELPETVTEEVASPEIIDEFDESALLADELPETVTEEVASPEIIDEFDESALLADELPETVSEEVATPKIIDEFDESALLADELPETVTEEVASPEIIDEFDESALIADELPETVSEEIASPEIIDEFDESALLADELPETVTEEVASPEIIDEFDESALLADELPETVTEEVASPEIIDEFDESALIADELPNEDGLVFSDEPILSEEDIAQEILAQQQVESSLNNIFSEESDENIEETPLPVFDEISLAAEENALRHVTDDFIDDLPNIEALAETNLPATFTDDAADTQDLSKINESELLISDDMGDEDFMPDTDDISAVSAMSQPQQTQVANTAVTHTSPTTQEFSRSSKLETAANEVVAVTDVLSETLRKFVTEEDDSDGFLEAIEGYTNTVQALWEKAEIDSLSGLQEVYTFINDSFFEFSTLPQAERLASYEHLSHWTEFVLEYLRTPQQGAPLLLEYLQDTQWPSPMSKATANNLLGKLTREGIVPAIETSYAKRVSPSSNLLASIKPVTTTTQTVVTPPKVETSATIPTNAVETITSKSPEEPEEIEIEKISISEKLPPARLSIPEEEIPTLEIEIDKPDWGGAFIDDDVLLASEMNDEEENFALDSSEEETALPPQSFEQDDVPSETSTEDGLNLSHLDVLADNEAVMTETVADSLMTDIDTIVMDEAVETLTMPEDNSPDLVTENEANFLEDASVETARTLETNEHLDALLLEIEEVQTDLVRVIAKFAQSDDESPELLESIEELTDNLQAIYDAANLANLEGLQTTCGILINHIMELGEQAQANRIASKSLLDSCAPHLLAYMQEPAENATTLVKYLQHPVWTNPIDDEQADILLAQLMQLAGTEQQFSDELPAESDSTETRDAGTIDTLSAETITEIENALTDESMLSDIPAQTTTDNSIQLAAADVIELLIAQLTDANTILLENFIAVTEAENNSEALLNAVSEYSESVQSIWEATELAQLMGLQEVCTFVNDNIMALSSQDQESRLSVQALFTDWIGLAIAYLQAPNTGAMPLVEFLQQPTWAYPLDDERAAELHAHLLTPVTSTPTTPINDDSALLENIEDAETVMLEEAESLPDLSTFDTEEVIEESSELHEPLVTDNDELMNDELSDLPELDTEDLSTAETEPVTEIVIASPDIIELLIGQFTDTAETLQAPLQALTTEEDGSEALLMAVENYTEQVQVLWDAADMAKLEGLQTVCTFINDNVMGLSAQTLTERQTAVSAFEHWIPAVIEYLQAPAGYASQLVEQLQQPAWVTPLSDEQALELLEKLTQTSAETELSSISSEINDVASLATELPNVETISETAEADIQLADPDILAILIGQLHDTKSQLTDIVQTIVNAETGSEDSLMAVGSYTEQVQAVWDAAEMAQLQGLQTVCTFVNDNAMQLGMAEPEIRAAAQSILTDWIDASIAYLENPRLGVESLLEILQNFAWVQPLEEERLTALRQQLLPNSHASATTADTKPLVIASPDIIELLQNQIQDVIAGLSTALEECVSMENDNPALLEAIENYTNQVQAIWDAAEMAGLKGLQEVCTFINDNLMAFGTQEPAEKLAVKPYFEQWPIVVLEYLHNPLVGSQKLVELLQAPVWSVPLDEERASTLQQLLTQPSSSEEQTSAYQAEFADVDSITDTEEADSEEIDEEENAELSELDTSGGEGGEISLGSAEVLEILQSELESAKEELAENLGKYTSLANGAAGFDESVENYADQVMRLYAAAEMLGLEGLQEVSMFIAENVKALGEKDLGARQKAKKLLESWSDLVLSYLQSPADNVVKLVNHFREPQWATPLNDQQAYALLQKLMKGSTTEESPEEAAAYNRQTTANPEDILLTPPEDINRDLYDAYLQEVPQNAADFTKCIQNIIQEPTIPEIERAQRIAHTLKGSSNIIGIKGIANIAHHLEDILEYLAQNQVSPPKALTDTMTEAADCLEIMVDSLTGQDDPPPQALQVLQDVLDWANKIDKGNLDAPVAPRKAVQATPTTGSDKEDSGAEKAEPKKAAGGAPADTGSPEQVLRVPTSTVDNLMRLVGELSISIGQIHERLRHVLGNTRLLTDQGMVLQRKTFELENIVDIRGITGVENRYHKTAEDDEEFDPLEFEEYNELHSVAHSFIESIADARELGMSIRNDLSELETMLIQHERLNKEFQANIMTTRMVPVSTIISKLQRNIRQTCRMTGKQAELEVIGTDIMIDSDVLNNLADPLMHILRNSVDHGIESSEDRSILGKPESGTIVLRFYREGNNIVVSCKDDGQGLNYTNIRYTAIQRGLITETQEMSEPELARLILMSGFSTKSGVTQVSGRGVGMDVVYTNVRQMKGTLDLLSETGKGTNIIIKLPMSLVTLHVLVIRIGQYHYGIPTNTLEQALAPESGEFHQIGNEITFKMGKKVFALKNMSSLLNVQGDPFAPEDYHTKPVLLVHEETGVTAVLVDELLDTHDLVMKNMGKYVTKVRGVSGAAILGDGNLVPLLDVPELLRSPMQMALSNYMGQQASDDAGNAPAGVPKILIVDDSLSVRKSLSTFVEDAGFEALLAKDGVEAIEVMNQTRPNVMLVDMEMPRMNGLELTAHVRANPATQKLPIFMITSRTTEKHREQARTAGVTAYLTKPYQDTELLDWIEKGLAGQV
ncbi:chemotaxis protein histidine kinase-like protein [Beggiatoa alba B18LD]|uniref:Chemotaxis protein CheA n=1 Tax=Beggiatoa alba B18LD TaxID=395493 RepID=I3CJK4_9GAMM|nr:response regulator [Beggiatoa alba]EIJ43797.1 chemotaxis protein histidine kinase-like protein [Beggiatoa alba B18LD]